MVAAFFRSAAPFTIDASADDKLAASVLSAVMPDAALKDEEAKAAARIPNRTLAGGG